MNNDDAENLKIKADKFNNYCANVGEVIYTDSQKYLTENNITHHNNLNEDIGPINFRPQPIDSIFVILVIKHLKNSRSHGPDEIPLKYLKESMPVTVQYLT